TSVHIALARYITTSDKIEESEGIFVKLYTTSQVINIDTADIGETTEITPKVVATPFPPRNLSHTVYICPNTTATPATPTNTGSFSVLCTTYAANAPLPTSKNNVSRASLAPPTRKALVAPMLPE